MKFLTPFLAATALAATPALAQNAAAPGAAAELANGQVQAGATVYGPEGNEVGTIEGVVDGIATLDTGTHKAPLPLSAFGQGANGPTITVTREQLNVIIEQQLAEVAQTRDAALVQGAAVLSADNQPVGTVEQVSGDNVIVQRSGTQARFGLARNLFSVDAAGLKTRLTLQEIDASLRQTAGTASTQ